MRSLATGDSSESECKETKHVESLKYHTDLFFRGYKEPNMVSMLEGEQQNNKV